MGAERRLLEECAIDWLVANTHQRRAVGARAARLELSSLETICQRELSAVGAGAAPGKRDDDVVAGHDLAHRRADRDHLAGAFVTEHGGIFERRIVAVAGVQIGLAHATRGDPDQHFVGSRLGQHDLANFKRLVLLGYDRGRDIHDAPETRPIATSPP